MSNLLRGRTRSDSPGTTSGRSERRNWIKSTLALLVGSLAALIAGEILLRISRTSWDPSIVLKSSVRVPLHAPCGSCQWIYGLNPEHPQVTSQGLRDRVFEIPKPKGTFRILVLGDSVSYGAGLKAKFTFPKVLERLLGNDHRRIEVVNAGVKGYGPWNELHWYATRGRTFEPDLVIVQFTMNDVVDPELHWNWISRSQLRVPRASLPNPTYHDEHIAPKLRVIGLRNSPSMILRFAARRLYPIWNQRRLEKFRWEIVDGERIPVHLTGGDTISIHVLMDEDSAEWDWLQRIYRELQSEVRSDKIPLVLLIVPLAYQLDQGYPYRPQTLLARFCEAQSIQVLDLLPRFSGLPSDRIFMRHADERTYDDVWHLTKAGHGLVAEILRDFLVDQNLLPEPI